MLNILVLAATLATAPTDVTLRIDGVAARGQVSVETMWIDLFPGIDIDVDGQVSEPTPDSVDTCWGPCAVACASQVRNAYCTSWVGNCYTMNGGVKCVCGFFCARVKQGGKKFTPRPDEGNEMIQPCP